jgi:Ethanolamine utilization protein EutJ (predicted chaperonin)
MSTFYKLLEDVALAKEGSPLKKLASITIKICRRALRRSFSEEDTRGVTAICESSGIEWIHVVQKPRAATKVIRWYTDYLDTRG